MARARQERVTGPDGIEAQALSSLSQFQQRRRLWLFCHHALPRRQQISDANGHSVLRSILKAAVHHAARRCGGRVRSLLEVGRELVSTGVLCRKASSSICLTRKSATSAREMNPQVQSRGSTNAR